MNTETYQNIARQLNFKPNVFRLARHLIADAFLALVIWRALGGPHSWLAQLCLPVLMFRSFSLMHDCLHNSATKNRHASDVIGILTGAFCLLPYEPWKRIHLSHHKWSGNVDNDPSMGLIKKMPHQGRFHNKALNFFWRTWLPGLAIAQHFVFWTKSYQFVREAKGGPERWRNFFSVAVPLLLYTQLPWANLWPGIVLYLAMVEVVNFPHHLQMPMQSGGNSLRARDQYLTARSCIYPAWLAHHVLNNFNLHIEHHLFPHLPWYRLPEARRLIKPALGASYTEVKNNAWIRANRKKSIEEVFAANFSEPTNQNTADAA